MNTGDGATGSVANARGAIAVGAAAWFETPRFGVSPPLAGTFRGGGVPMFRSLQRLRRQCGGWAAPAGQHGILRGARRHFRRRRRISELRAARAAPHVAGVGRAAAGPHCAVAALAPALGSCPQAGAVDMAAPATTRPGTRVVDARAAFDALTGKNRPVNDRIDSRAITFSILAVPQRESMTLGRAPARLRCRSRLHRIAHFLRRKR
jgi:hypothetical protein